MPGSRVQWHGIGKTISRHRCTVREEEMYSTRQAGRLLDLPYWPDKIWLQNWHTFFSLKIVKNCRLLCCLLMNFYHVKGVNGMKSSTQGNTPSTVQGHPLVCLIRQIQFHELRLNHPNSLDRISSSHACPVAEFSDTVGKMILSRHRCAVLWRRNVFHAAGRSSAISGAEQTTRITRWLQNWNKILSQISKKDTKQGSQIVCSSILSRQQTGYKIDTKFFQKLRSSCECEPHSKKTTAPLRTTILRYRKCL